MARIFTTPESEAAAKVFMHDILVVGGTGIKNLRNSTPYNWSRNSYRAAATTICKELTDRDFADINLAIATVAGYNFYPNYDDSGRSKSFKPEVVAKAIVYMAERLGLYWDDTVRTPYEVDEFRKTLLGDAVYKYGRYISAIKDTATKNHAASKASTPKVAGGAPQNGYKSSGPQSGNARGLLGNPGDKAFADTEISYRIEGDKTKTNTPKVFIKPLTASAADGNNSNKIYISSGNGYTDCVCYFDDPNDAQNFLNKILPDVQKLIQEKRANTDITNLRVVKVKSDPNGYFLVNTEYGPCAISARTLNEAMAEALEEDTNRGACWEKATEGCSRKELEELHTWMRRD
jgi:hypothetical protein